ncbi:MAG: serine/threonine protein kinase [Myxococcales bacterium]|nr:MAG: serine/threonine protein kinase [Myxococcales bacterium]
MFETSAAAGSSSGKYRTLLELGQGGTANVSLAVAGGPEGFRKLFVMKQLRSIYAQDSDFRAMFMTEGRLSAQLNHPHVVQVYEVFEDVTPTIVMEYIEGQTLDAVLAVSDPKLPLELHLRVLADVLSGLHYSHELRGHDHAPLEVVHRDVSPHNVMISYEGVVKVLDFGIAQLAGSTVETETGVVKGKLRYMPPEQVAGEEVDRRADVFAVGVMLWEALSGVRLWKGLPDAAIMNRVLAGAIPEPKNEHEPIPPELLAICKRSLAPQRTARYQTARELEVALEEYLAARSHYASARELSRFMNERFARQREDIALRVELELGRRSHTTVAPSASRSAAPSRTSLTASRNVPTGAPPAKTWMVALGFLLLGIALVAWGMRSKEGPLPRATLAAPRSVSVWIQARPDSARIRVDDVPVSNPYAGTPLYDAKTHLVTISAPGFQAEQTSVRFDADVRIVTALSPLVAPASAGLVPSAAPIVLPRPRGTSAPATSPNVPPASASAAPATAEAPESACDPPFYYAGGIKKFKPECL